MVIQSLSRFPLGSPLDLCKVLLHLPLAKRKSLLNWFAGDVGAAKIERKWRSGRHPFQQMELSISRKDLQTLWLIGTLERLSSLGFLQDVPYALDPCTVDLYLSLNSHYLFDGDDYLKEKVEELILGVSPGDSAVKDEIDEISSLVVEYRNNPSRISQMGFECISEGLP